MEDRCFDHLRDIAAIVGRARVRRSADRKTNLIIDDDVNRSTSAKTIDLRHLECFGNNALPRKSRITMNEHGQYFVAFRVATTLLASPYRTFDDRVDDLEVRWIERQDDVDIAARGLHIGRISLVILHIAGSLEFVRIVSTLELLEQLLRRLAKNIDQNVHSATMCHADDDFFDAGHTTLLDDVVEHRNQTFGTFKRKPFLTHISSMQIAFNTLGTGELLENQETFLIAQSVSSRSLLKSFPQPKALARP